jgi:hypothetical protein
MAGFRFPAEAKDVLFSTASRPALGTAQPPMQWVPGTSFPRVRQQERETDHSHIPSAEVNNGRPIPPPLYKSPWRGAEINKQRDFSFLHLVFLLDFVTGSRLDSSGTEYVLVSGSCEHSKEPSVCIRNGNDLTK